MAYIHRIENGEVVAYLERSYGYEKDENGEYRAKEPEASVIREIYDLVIQGVNCTNIARVLNARNIQTVQGKDENGEYRAKEPEASVIREIYDLVIQGVNCTNIARVLNARNIQTVQGAEWTASTVFRIVENEIYKGDVLMQKTFIDGKRHQVQNRGEKAMYYAKDNWTASTVFRIVENEIYKGDVLMQKTFIDGKRHQVQNRGEKAMYYAKDNHPPIVSEKTWEKAQRKLEDMRAERAEHSVIQEFTEENYPYMNHIFCAKCGWPLKPRVYSHGHRLSWDCSGQKRGTKKFCTGIHNYPYMNHIFCAKCGWPLKPRVYSHGHRLSWDCSGQKRGTKKFCTGIHVLDNDLRKMKIEGNRYFSETVDKYGEVHLKHVGERTWKNKHKKKKFNHKELYPELNEENYPYYKRLYCARCGSRLGRYISHGTVRWICLNYKRKGQAKCPGVRIPDEIIKGWNLPDGKIYIMGKEDKNGEKHYSYTSESAL